MKKEGNSFTKLITLLLIITIVSPIFIVLLNGLTWLGVIVSENQGPTDLPTISTSTINFTSEFALVNESGNDVPLILAQNISQTQTIDTPSVKLGNLKYYDVTVNTSNWDIKKTNLTVSNLNAENISEYIENYPEEVIGNQLSAGSLFFHDAVVAAMSIRISTDVRLTNLSFFIQDVSSVNRTWSVTIFNSTLFMYYGLIPHPDRNITRQFSIEIPSDKSHAHWDTFDTQDVVLEVNSSRTYVDQKGYAYYFAVIEMQAESTNTKYTYFANDTTNEDGGFAWYGVKTKPLFGAHYIIPYYLAGDLCMKIGMSPVHEPPSVDDLGMKVINPEIDEAVNVTVESGRADAMLNIYNYSNRLSILACQNFTIDTPGKIRNITLYMKVTGQIQSPISLLIMPPNATKDGPDMGNSPGDFAVRIIDISDPWAINLEPGSPDFIGWHSFVFSEAIQLEPGMYWWVLSVNTNNSSQGNATIYGNSSSTSDSWALNNTFDSNSGVWDWKYSERLSGTFACIYGFLEGYEFLNFTNNSWESNATLNPDSNGFYTFKIISKWLGSISFDSTAFCRIQREQNATTRFEANVEWDFINWTVSTRTLFPFNTIDSQDLMNLTLPLWNITRVQNGPSIYDDWVLFTTTENQTLQVRNASSGEWTIIANHTNPYCEIGKYQKSGSDWEPVTNGTIFENYGFNMTLKSQSTGEARIIGLYPEPNNFTTFELTNNYPVGVSSSLDNLDFYWNPEEDPLVIGGTYQFLAYWKNGTHAAITNFTFFILPNPTNLTLITSFSRNPYVNDTSQSIIVLYNESRRAENISGAIIVAKLDNISLDWEDIYFKSQLEEDQGKYRIYLNTTGLAPGVYTLTAYAFKQGYENVSLTPIQITVDPLPTILTTFISNITQYEREQITVTVSFKDTFHDAAIDWG
ncbi:MAG: hypothetical protein ACXQS8_09740, partial [Candidatus Helarchaeales archaeon]